MIFPRTFRQQASLGTSVQNLERGDLISFTNQDLYTDGRVGHVGIYMGNGDMTHASSSRGVHIAENFMEIGYWQAKLFIEMSNWINRKNEEADSKGVCNLLKNTAAV